MRKKFIYAILIAHLIFCFSWIKAQSPLIKVRLNDTSKIYAFTMRSDPPFAERVLDNLRKVSDKSSISDLMIVAAKQMLQTPYVAATLEGGEEEQLRVFLHKTDCILFVESCLDLSLCAKNFKEEASFELFAELVRESRYRNGKVEDYSDRIHYTTEWIRQGEKRGVVKDISEEIGGVVYNHPIFYMSKHYDKYTHLAPAANYMKWLGNKSQIDTLSASFSEAKRSYNSLKVIENVEKELNSKPFYYIPQNDIPKIEKYIKNGDIICYMSGVEGLDIAHVAIAYINNGKVGFIHASMGAMKVIVDPKSIYEYVKSSKNITGIKVVRPQ